MSGAELAARFATLCAAITIYGLTAKIAQLALFALNHWRRSE